MTYSMKREKMNYMRILVVLAALTCGAVGEVWGQTDIDPNNILIPENSSSGSISKSVSGRTVTLTVTPASGYYIKASDIVVEKLVNTGKANAPTRRVPDLADLIVGKMYSSSGQTDADIISSVEYSNSAQYVFTVPEGYDGAYVTATFRSLTEGDIIRITASTNLGENPDMTKHYVLVDDVSASVVNKFYSDTPFTGIFEGEAKADGSLPKITGLEHALFQTVNGGIVKNIMLDNVDISNGTNVGAIANEMTGTFDKKAAIYNCGVLSGSVSGSGYVGGIVGLLGNPANNDTGKNQCYARVINCFSYASVGGGSEVGGIVGYNSFASTAANIRTMVMNCMFYGDITGGTTVSPVFGGNNIANLQGGLNTFNYYSYESASTFKARAENATNKKYNSALAVEEKYLNRFEFYRLLLNSNKKLAAFYATGSTENADQKMAKWVLETADRSINGRDPYPYPILKAQGYYPSIINPDFENAPDSTTVGRNKGGKLPAQRRVLYVTISGSQTTGGQTKPTGASIKRSYLELTRTDKDFDRFNYNYDKVQLPYYNDVGTGNYTDNRVVTGWKITAITSITGDPYTSANYPTTGIKDFPDHNYADRKSSNKDLYSVSKRVFSQGAYFDVPYGVTSITIEPYWGKAYYIADPNYDVVYKNDYSGKQGVSQTGTQVTVVTTGNTSSTTTEFKEQNVETSIERALNNINNNMGGWGPTVYDNALVLVGNLHLNTVPQNGTTPFTMMSVDEDNDHEPDYSLIYHHTGRSSITPIRYDFLNIPGTAQAQKPNGASLICNFTIFKTRGWFEVTNTALFYTSQLEYENLDNNTKTDAPLILLGGVVDQFVSTQSKAVTGKTIYIHVGGNVWIKEFGMGTHSDGSESTPHVPVSVTGGEFPGFYLTGTYNANAAVRTDNAECYISGGYIHEAAGASLEQINGNVHWQIYNADIDEFFGGGINDAKPIKGNITTDIFNSHVTLFCGGPKFGNMQTGKKVTTNAEGCTFGKFFGAGYGGTSLTKKKYYDEKTPAWGTTLQGYYITDRGKYFDGSTTNSRDGGTGNNQYGKKGLGVATDFDYEFFVWSSGTTGGRFFVKFAAFSLAQCNNVESKLKNCTVNENFYGGGSLGKVVGTVTSELEDCTVKGNVFGSGYSASLPTLEVRNEGFASDGGTGFKVPKFNSGSGMFEPGTPSGTKTFTWRNISNANDDGFTNIQLVESGNNKGKIQNGTSGSYEKENENENENKHYLYTDINLSNSNLGSVDGDVILTIKGDSKVGYDEDGNSVEGGGNVFGGGEQSYVTGATHTVTVNVEGNTEVLGNVFGGGDNGVVEGHTIVNIQDTPTQSGDTEP